MSTYLINPGAIVIAAFLGPLCPCSAIAAESKPIPFRATEHSFQRFIVSLRAAAQKKDAPAVYAVLASNYYLARDFGGSFDPAGSSVQNFSVTFQFDNDKLFPKYRNQGWREFRQALSGRNFEKKRDGQLCIPHGALDRKPFPEAQLCFRKIGSHWRIQGHINGGD